MSDLVENPEDRFSKNKAQIKSSKAECIYWGDTFAVYQVKSYTIHSCENLLSTKSIDSHIVSVDNGQPISLVSLTVTTQSKDVKLGQLPFSTVSTQSTAQIGIVVLPLWYLYLMLDL